MKSTSIQCQKGSSKQVHGKPRQNFGEAKTMKSLMKSWFSWTVEKEGKVVELWSEQESVFHLQNLINQLALF